MARLLDALDGAHPHPHLHLSSFPPSFPSSPLLSLPSPPLPPRPQPHSAPFPPSPPWKRRTSAARARRCVRSHSCDAAQANKPTPAGVLTSLLPPLPPTVLRVRALQDVEPKRQAMDDADEEETLTTTVRAIIPAKVGAAACVLLFFFLLSKRLRTRRPRWRSSGSRQDHRPRLCPPGACSKLAEALWRARTARTAPESAPWTLQLSAAGAGAGEVCGSPRAAGAPVGRCRAAARVPPPAAAVRHTLVRLLARGRAQTARRSSTRHAVTNNPNDQISPCFALWLPCAALQEAGAIIGRSGMTVKFIREQSQARINISDSGAAERAISVTSTAEGIFR